MKLAEPHRTWTEALEEVARSDERVPPRNEISNCMTHYFEVISSQSGNTLLHLLRFKTE